MNPDRIPIARERNEAMPRNGWKRPARAPWPGPRPFTRDDSDLLFGRTAETSRLVQMVEAYPVTELIAPSGVGKTSLLEAGLAPALEKRGCTVVICRDWGSASGRSPAHAYFRAVWRGAFKGRPAPPQVNKGGSSDLLRILADQLAEGFEGRRVVVIFDQLEELLRLDSVLGYRFLDLVSVVAGDYAESYDLRQVVALRREYKAELKDLEAALMPRGMALMDLQAINREILADIISRPASVVGLVIEKQAVAELLKWWKDAAAIRSSLGQVGPNGPRSRTRIVGSEALGGTTVGLLHLQAVLWSVYEHWAARRASEDRDDDTTMSLADLWEFASERLGRAADISSRQAHAELVASSIYRYVADAATGGRESLSPEKRTSAITGARMAPHLSSGGYKLARDEGQLAWLAVGRDMETLGLDLEATERAVRVAMDAAGGRSSDYLPPANDLAFHMDPRLDAQRDGWTAGRARGLNRTEAARELVRSFRDATAAFRSANILRQTPGVAKTRRYELVHDGFGPALEAWGRAKLAEPVVAVDSLTAIRGQSFLWESFSRPEFECVDGACWQGCFVAHPRHASGARLAISGIEFTGCDLRGTVFVRCDFSGCVFDDCFVPGVIFQDCKFDEVRLTRSTLDGAVFKDCEVGELEFSSITADGLAFSNISGSRISFVSCAARHVSFRLKGAMIVSVVSSVASQWYFEATEFDGTIEMAKSSVLFVDVERNESKPIQLRISNCDLVQAMIPKEAIIATDCNVQIVAAEYASRPTLVHTPSGMDPWKVARSTSPPMQK